MAAEGMQSFDVAIVGGGPAGLAAASELRRLGVGSVAIIEREANAGGIPRHCGHYPFGMREFNRILTGPDYAARLAGRAEHAGVHLITGTSVVGVLPGPCLSLSGPSGLSELRASRVLLATGVREASRSARLIGGTRPGGVISTGALQGLVYLNRQTPFQRPIVLGSELVSFSALLTCRHVGIRPRGMVEPNARITAFKPSAMLPRLLGVPVWLGTDVSRIIGDRWIEAVELRNGEGQSRLVETDGLIVSGQFQPEAALLHDSHLDCDPASGGPVIDQFGRCSDPHFFAAGNLLRAVETAGWSWSEGRRTARAIALSLEGKLAMPQGAMELMPAGDGVKYVVPQRVIVDGANGSDLQGGACRQIQLRVTRPVRGKLIASLDGCEVWSRSLSALPERRILVALSALPRQPGASLQFSIGNSSS